MPSRQDRLIHWLLGSLASVTTLDVKLLLGPLALGGSDELDLDPVHVGASHLARHLALGVIGQRRGRDDRPDRPGQHGRAK